MQRDRAPRRLRHDHHRRGPRAQPQHRLPARLPQAAAAAAARPEADHHLGDDRHRALRRALRRRAGRSRCRAARYPVEVRYRPLRRRGRRRPRPGAGRSSTRSTSCPARARATCSCSCRGEREIRETADALRRRHPRRHRGRCRCTPGCRRPSSTASSSRTGRRRIVLATNVAETSLTVPGIRYVVDPGTARISRYSRRTQGAAAADRADLAGVGQPARRPLRARRARHLHPAVREDDFARAARVHRAGDPAHEPRRRSSCR